MVKNAHYLNVMKTTAEVDKEIRDGLHLLNSIDRPIVTFLGSARTKATDRHFKHCERVGYALGKRGYAVVTGGGPGIMEAANAGAKRSGSISIGLQMTMLKNEKSLNSVFTAHYRFHFMFVRRFILSIKAKALIFYPGGFGTLNELFEYVCLIQTGIVDRVPIIMVDRKYWKGLMGWIESELVTNKMIKKEDMSIFYHADTVEEVVAHVTRKV